MFARGRGAVWIARGGRAWSRACRWLSVLLLSAAILGACGHGSTTAAQPGATQAAASQAAPRSPEEFYGPWVLVPPLVTIALAIAVRQVIPALAIGILVAAYMLLPCLEPEAAFGGGPVGGLRLAVEKYLVGALADVSHIKILLFTLMIGGMVGIIGASGGTGAVVERVARWASSRRSGQVVTWAAGLVVFFDDYANAMIVGPSLRPICDRLRISRAKLAYIVDSTAAPVASVALIGTWVGFEIGLIQEGLDALHPRPGFLAELTGYGAFLSSIPYRFYALLALVMVLLVGWLNRDFGPMRKSERRVAETAGGPQPVARADAAGADSVPAVGRVGRMWYALLPLALLVFVTIGLLVVTGWAQTRADAAAAQALVDQAARNGQPVAPELARRAAVPGGLALVQRIVSNSDSFNSILYGALIAIIAAGAISLLAARLSIAATVEAATAAMARMFPTFVVLVLAWGLSAAMQDLHLGQIAAGLLQRAQFNPLWLPLLIFLAGCLVSFATGTSWGTLGILCPATVTIAASLLAGLPSEQALPLFYAAVGAVLAGAVFGDHCSPISDTTVLSALASDCSLEEHVWTQMPYALTVAGVSIVCGDGLCRVLELPVWAGLLAGSVALAVILLAVGRKPVPQK